MTGISIELSVVDNTYIQITASDVTGLSYITYKWNSDEEITAYPSGENNTVIIQNTEIPSGLNTLTVLAVNSSNYTLTKSQDVKGVHAPQISLLILDGELIVTVTDDEGIDTISQQINDGEETVVNCDGVLEYELKTYVGDENIIVSITATDVEGVDKTVRGKNY